MRNDRRSGAMRLALLVQAAVLVTPVVVFGQAPPGVHQMKSAGGAPVLVDQKMMTLYTFANDTSGVSNCNDNCAKNWPPLMAAANAKPGGNWTIITRADGTRQWAYKGMPVYTWSKDQKPGDATGDGMAMGAWKMLAP